MFVMIAILSNVLVGPSCLVLGWWVNMPYLASTYLGWRVFRKQTRMRFLNFYWVVQCVRCVSNVAPLSLYIFLTKFNTFEPWDFSFKYTCKLQQYLLTMKFLSFLLQHFHVAMRMNFRISIVGPFGTHITPCQITSILRISSASPVSSMLVPRELHGKW